MIVLKRPDELVQMRAAGRVVAEIIAALPKWIAPGGGTPDIDTAVAARLTTAGGTWGFLNYPDHEGGKPFPAHTWISINEELVHGIPGKRTLKEGDIVSVDVGAVLNGWVGDAAWTFPVGKVSPTAQKL